MANYPLLWRRTRPPERSGTGRPPRLTVDEVVAAAIRIADANGLEAASMARVAADLGVATMTLYTYVPSRADLIDLMVDEAQLERTLINPEKSDSVRRFAAQTTTMFTKHPWLTEVTLARPPLGPGTMREREFMIAAMTHRGLPTDRINRAANALTAYIYAFAREAGENARLKRITGQTTESWWQEHSDFWENWFDVDAHPAMTALWNAGGFEGDQAQDAFEYGLDLLLRGLVE
ncbi:TetR/AcrR family transcriptional regulator C-terminal domain-containing protein [Actinoplanes sp. NPDC051861]|uniref:TetR/AcrR family transcriptional regulator n=1 Tax=Actinoplanes sp. NPDC051861 TaxID=3155170 RepID=UPI0034288706